MGTDTIDREAWIEVKERARVLERIRSTTTAVIYLMDGSDPGVICPLCEDLPLPDVLCWLCAGEGTL